MSDEQRSLRRVIDQVVLAGDLGNDEDAPTLLQTADEHTYVTETRKGLTFRLDTPLAVWGGLTARLIRAHRRLEFALADCINFGDEVMKPRHGEMYSQWLSATGRSYQGLKDIAWVGRAIPLEVRRDDVDFSTQREVASLPPPVQASVLKLVAAHDWSRDQTRDAVKVAQRQIQLAQRAALPVPTRTHPDALLAVADARALPLPDGLVHLIVTSPPYALEKQYGDEGDIAPLAWRAFMGEWLAEAYRVAAPSARLCLNVPLDTTSGGYRPTYAQAVAAAQRAGWTYRTTAVWVDDQLGKSTARGSYDAERRVGTAQAPHVIAPVEMIPLFSKGEWRRPEPPDRPSDLEQPEWVAWTNGLWHIAGESQAWEGHPAAFRRELPRRCIRLLSFPGDIVLDPFSGSGTTVLEAVAQGRRGIGFDTSLGYVRGARRRLEQQGPRQ